MAHLLEIVNGRARMAYTGKIPWHATETKPVLVDDKSAAVDERCEPGGAR